MLEKKGDLSGALEFNRREREISKELASADPSNRLAAANVGFSDLSVGEILVRQGKIAQAMPPIREAVATFHRTNVSQNLWDATGLGQS